MATEMTDAKRGTLRGAREAATHQATGFAPIPTQLIPAFLVSLVRPSAAVADTVTLSVSMRITDASGAGRPTLDVARLQRALDLVVHRQDALRTRFQRHRLVTLPPGSVPLVVEDTDDAELPSRLTALQRTPVPLDAPPSLRAFLTTTPTEAVLTLVVHHLTCDVTGLGLIVEDLGRAYADDAIPMPALSYGGYARWQQATHRRGDARPGFGHADPAGDLPFWRATMSSAPARAIETDHRFWPGIPGATGTELVQPLLDASETRHLHQLALRHRATPLVWLLAVHDILMSARTSSSRRLTVTLLDQRDHPAARELVGCFLRWTPLVTTFDPDASFGTSLAATARHVVEASRRTSTSLLRVALWRPRLVAGVFGLVPPAFTFFQYIPRRSTGRVRFGDDLFAHEVETGASIAHEPGIAVRVSETREGGLELRVGFEARLYTRDSIAALLEAWRMVIRRTLEDPAARLGDLAASTAW